jgi:hypothetical protein
MKNFIVIILFYGICFTTSCSGQKQEQNEEYYIKKATQFLDKYLPKIESYQETIYQDYFVKLTPDDYSFIYELYPNTSSLCRSKNMLRKNLNLDSILFENVAFLEEFIYQRIEYFREDTAKFNRIKKTVKNNAARYGDNLCWISNNNGSNMCVLLQQSYDEYQKFQELYTYGVGSITVTFLRDIKSENNVIFFNILSNHNDSKSPIELSILLRENINSTQ